MDNVSIGIRLDATWRDHVPPEWTSGWSPRPFALEGGTTEVVEMGSGPTVLLLPPLPGFKEAWLPLAALLARWFRVVTFDLRERLPARGGWEVLVRDLDRVADALAPGPVGVIGHSLGGALAQRWALAHPERVRALVLTSSFARVSTPPGDMVGRFLAQPLVLASQRWLPNALALPLARRLARRRAWVYDPACDDAVLAIVRSGIRSVSPASAAARVRLALEHDLRRELQTLHLPTLLVVGERETEFARAATAELARLIPGAETMVSRDAAHLHPLSRAPWLAAALTEWLTPRLAPPGA
jgi:pimeloyl-ACP methyl ester carboxylesterase